MEEKKIAINTRNKVCKGKRTSKGNKEENEETNMEKKR